MTLDYTTDPQRDADEPILLETCPDCGDVHECQNQCGLIDCPTCGYCEIDG
jgi:hypothetical protein